MEERHSNVKGPEDFKQFGELVADRFEEAIDRADSNGENILSIDGMERAMIGTTEINGHIVPVYEESLCIQCIMDSFDDDWADSMGFTEEQKADPDFIENEKYTEAVQWFEYNTLRALPYEGDVAPIIVTGFMVDMDKWPAMLPKKTIEAKKVVETEALTDETESKDAEDK